VNNAKDAVQASSNSLFNKVRFTAKSVQTAYVVDGIQQGIAYQRVVIQSEGRLRAYSFFENWEPAVISCEQPVVGDPKVTLEIDK
jgi:hypothetical protein